MKSIRHPATGPDPALLDIQPTARFLSILILGSKKILNSDLRSGFYQNTTLCFRIKKGPKGPKKDPKKYPGLFSLLSGHPAVLLRHSVVGFGGAYR